MATSTETLKGDLHKSIKDLRKLREEIRIELRAAGADAREQWKKFLEPQLASVEDLVQEIGQASRAAVARTSLAFGEFKTSLKKGRPATRRAWGAKRAGSKH